MGYRGKVHEQERARALRATGLTLIEIAEELDVSKSSVSVWVRDVPFTPSPRRTGPHRRPHPFHERRLAEIDEMDATGRDRIGTLSDEAFLAAGVALYAGEGAKTDGTVKFANSDPAMIAFFCAWLRRFFDIDERRSAARLVRRTLDLLRKIVLKHDKDFPLITIRIVNPRFVLKRVAASRLHFFTGN